LEAAAATRVVFVAAGTVAWKDLELGMTRTMSVALLVGALVGGAAAATTAQGRGASNPQAALRSDVDRMTGSLGGARATPRQAMANVQRLALGYRSLIPVVGRFGPADYALNRMMAQRSLAYLGRTSVWYMNDPLAARAYLDAYDTIGGFYRDQARFYSPGAYVAYAGAARLARRLMLGTAYDWSVRELDRYALAYGTMATLDGRYIGRWADPQDLPPDAPAPESVVPLKPLDVPKVDTSKLTPAQREAWDDVRVRFRSVASQVHGARVLLDQLAARLHQQHLALHPANAATAMKMQGFLEDAADLIESKEFETATDALRRADAERAKLKGVTGQ
jgi:hypothetical protein